LKINVTGNKLMDLESDIVEIGSKEEKEMDIMGLICYLNIDVNKIGIVLANDKRVDGNYIIKENDTIKFLLPISGG